MTATIVAVWALYVFAVHTFAGQRRVATPLVESKVAPFARGTMEVVWHAYSWNLLVCAAAIGWHAWAPQPTLVWFVTLQMAGIGAVFLWLGPKRLGSGFGLPQWVLIGPLVVALALLDAPRLATSLLLLALAGLHVAWVLGVAWPAPSRRAMPAYLIGHPEGDGVGRLPTAMVALVLTGLALAVWLTVPGARMVVVVVFGARGLFGFVERQLRPETAKTPYAVLSRIFYSPLCLFIAALAFSSR